MVFRHGCYRLLIQQPMPGFFLITFVPDLGFLTFRSLLPAINSPQAMRLSRAEAPERPNKFYVRKFSGHYLRLLGTRVPERLPLLLGFFLPRYPRLPSLGLLCPIRDYLFWVTFSLTVIHLHVAS